MKEVYNFVLVLPIFLVLPICKRKLRKHETFIKLLEAKKCGTQTLLERNYNKDDDDDEYDWEENYDDWRKRGKKEKSDKMNKSYEYSFQINLEIKRL